MRGTYLAAFVAALLLAAAPASAADRESGGRVVAGLGKAVVDGKQATVEVLVAVPAGASATAAKDKALRAQGAAPVASGFSFIGLVWDTASVTQNYNASGERTSGLSALRATHGPWSSVRGSRFRMGYGGPTSRCPSLVKECPGAQRNDRFNDVGWARLANGTLGVTWTTSTIDEADMAINTRYTWSLGCTNVAGAFDLQSVFLHENGHVAGLGHSTDITAVMYPSYQAARCALAADDQAGIRALYPA
jgi:hypothetical protein